ncbi:hypothetical protein UlMin_015762 [Ulmus minor]
MELGDRERVLCASYMLKKDARHWWGAVKLRRDVGTMSWNDFVGEFNHKYYNPTALRAQQNEFLNLKQGSMTVMEAVRKFEQLARLCPFLANTEEERLRRMMDMFCPDIALAIESGGGPPTTVADCVDRAIWVEYRLEKLREERARHFEAKKSQKKESGTYQGKKYNQGSKLTHKPNQTIGFKKKRQPIGQWNQKNQPQKQNSQNYPPCKKCGRTHPGECRAKNPNICYRCGKERHYAKQCSNPPNLGNAPNQIKYPVPRAYAMQAQLEGPPINQGRLEAPEPEARIYAYTKGDAEAGTSNVVTGQLTVANSNAYILFDSGATHSFISTAHENQLDRAKDEISQAFRTSLPSGDVLVSTHWLRAIPVRVADRELYVDLIILDMYDYDIILGMDFLAKYNATIECRKRRVTFRPGNEDEFSFDGEPRKKGKAIISSMKARKMLLSGCQGFLASVVDTTQEEETKPEDIPIVQDFVEVFPKELPGLPVKPRTCMSLMNHGYVQFMVL